VCVCGLNLTDSEYDPVADSCEHDNESADFTESIEF
jgi:hypothetical protein